MVIAEKSDWFSADKAVASHNDAILLSRSEGKVGQVVLRRNMYWAWYQIALVASLGGDD